MYSVVYTCSDTVQQSSLSLYNVSPECKSADGRHPPKSLYRRRIESQLSVARLSLCIAT